VCSGTILRDSVVVIPLGRVRAVIGTERYPWLIATPRSSTRAVGSDNGGDLEAQHRRWCSAGRGQRVEEQVVTEDQ